MLIDKHGYSKKRRRDKIMRTLIWLTGKAVKYSWYAFLVLAFFGVFSLIIGSVLSFTLSYTYEADSFGAVFAPFIFFCIFSLGLLPLGLGAMLKFLYPIAVLSLILQASLYISKNHMGIENMTYLTVSTIAISLVPISLILLLLFSKNAQEYVVSSLRDKPKWK
jgi:hypothetical protein